MRVIIVKEKEIDSCFDLAVSKVTARCRQEGRNRDPDVTNMVDALERLFVFELEQLRQKIKDG